MVQKILSDICIYRNYDKFILTNSSFFFFNNSQVEKRKRNKNKKQYFFSSNEIHNCKHCITNKKKINSIKFIKKNHELIINNEFMITSFLIFSFFMVDFSKVEAFFEQLILVKKPKIGSLIITLKKKRKRKTKNYILTCKFESFNSTFCFVFFLVFIQQIFQEKVNALKILEIKNLLKSRLVRIK